MKRIILFFTVCLGLSVFQTTLADNSDTARAAAKRGQTTNVSLNTNSNRSIVSDVKRAETPQTKNVRTATKTSQQKVVSRTPTTQNTKTRTAVTKSTANKNISQRPSSAPKTSTVNRNVNTRKTTTNVENARSASETKNRKNVSRAAELNVAKIESIKSADYSKCKTVYYECMDEFCANKDANLRRCACSSRIHEFDNIKKQLNDAEDKMLDFNQRLLTVSLDKEDASAINIATEGEIAFQTKDRSESEKMLQKITKSLNSSGDSRINNELSAISLSLDMDTAWDDIDSLAGASTTSKNGLELYNAARPICVEMAKEVCSDDELKIAQDGYKLTIQQDCNTVAKSYDTLYNNAMEKIHESGALLDISRLSVYQQRNSDDTLTCKKKILEQLSDSSVCGENLYKCLDTTGEYIDPSTGKAFLSENLYNLTNLLREPGENEQWSKITQNEAFVNYLKSKKKFLDPAIEQCQDIADMVWKEFLDDALAQIKLAQNAKLEEIKRSCTTLVTECKTNAMDDLSEFDSRALSVFNVAADRTANEMCSTIQNSCVALMNIDTANTWASGMTGISTDITYNTIIDTCTQIGRDCIIQKCNGTAGNFALCNNIISDNRMSILKRDVCWNEVLECVRGADNLANMNELPIVKNRQNYYNSLYSGITFDEIPEFCNTATGTDLTACLIAEQIWGNCENNSDTAITTYLNIDNTLNSNKILTPNSGSTLLSWLAVNTNTTNNIASCSHYGCQINYQRDENGTCQLLSQSLTTDGVYSTRRNQIINVIINTLTNYCPTSVHDTFGNCCANGYKNNGVCVPEPTTGGQYNALLLLTTSCNSADSYYCPEYNSSDPRRLYIYCVTPLSSITYNSVDETYECLDGFWMLVDQYGNYFDIQNQNVAPIMTYKPDSTGAVCTYSYDGTWSFAPCTEISTPVPTNNEFMITYTN